jgi:hypothetical protein
MVKQDRKSILMAVDTRIKVLALVTLVIEVSFLGSVARLPEDKVFSALVVSAIFFVVVVLSVAAIEIADVWSKKKGPADVQPSPLTPDSPLLSQIIRGAVQTVCRGVTVPRSPEEAELRAFIFRKKDNRLVCTHFWAPDNLLVKEVVGLSFDLDRKLADKVVVVRAYFDKQPARTPVEPLPAGMQGVAGDVSEKLKFVLAAPIHNQDPEHSVWGVVDFDTSNEIGRALLNTEVSNNVMFHLAEHLRLLFSLSERGSVIEKTV